MPLVEDLAAVTLPRFVDDRGALVPLELTRNVPFPVLRLFWIQGVPRRAMRGVHAHLACQQYVCCIAGEVIIEAFDGFATRSIALRAGTALHVPARIFTSLQFDGPETVVLVLCDRPYEQSDYLDRPSFLALVHDRK
jgi:dTDP-4-dehydrorhamnose 3,5-epimerase-like enzyme